MSSTLEVIDSYLSLDETQYAQAPIVATRLATKGDGVDLYGTIPTWTATNLEIEFDVMFPTQLSGVIENHIDCAADGLNRLGIYTTATGTIRKIGGSPAIYLDDVLVIDNVVTPPMDGAVHKIKVVKTVDTNKIGTIGARYDTTNKSSWTIFNLRLTDLDNAANSRFYPMDETIATATFVDTSANAAHGTWYNRTAGDVVTVYPEAIKPTDQVTFAIRFEATGGTADPFLFTLGNLSAASSAIAAILRTDTGAVDIVRYVNGSAAGSQTVADLGASPIDGNVHTLVIKKTSSTECVAYLDDVAMTVTITGTAFALVMRQLTLNAKWDGSSATLKGGSNTHYAYLYQGALSDADITALMSGEHPAYVGDVKQGYNLAGDGDEVNGGTALTLYGSPTWYVPANATLSSPLSFPLSFGLSKTLTF